MESIGTVGLVLGSIGPVDLLIVVIFIGVVFAIVSAVGPRIGLPPLTKLGKAVFGALGALGAAASLLAILDALDVT